MKQGIMKTYIILFLRAVAAGITIGIGGVVFLTVDIKIVGALMFTVGLYTICVQELNLFTGKVGYLPNREPAYIIDLEIIWIGNFCGTYLAALAVKGTRAAGIAETAQAICTTKLNDNLLSLFLLGIFCGMLICKDKEPGDFVPRCRHLYSLRV
jgi:formate/nitrite transporter FocA (FNT family)